MDAYKCIVPSWHGGTLNSRRVASHLVKLVEGVGRCSPPDLHPLNWDGTEPNHTVTCMVTKATANDRRYLALSHDEFRWPRSGLCQSLVTTTTAIFCEFTSCTLMIE
ncbi:uncharacterized protein TNCV_475801 [Trichonephila clavipes]|nr:uncharacterized protein TNCV_475801 [Trichonephila clavipes]